MIWKILLWIKKAPSWVWGVVLSIVIGWGLIRHGEDRANEYNEKQQRDREQATRTRGREANEKINSSDSTVTDWLHGTNRFRD